VTSAGPALALLALGAALLFWQPPGSARRTRVRRVARAPDRGDAPVGASGRTRWSPRARLRDRGGGPPAPGRRRVESAVAGVAAFVVVGGGTGGAVAGIAAAFAVDRLLRRSRGTPADDGARDLPVACDLLAVCLAAGTPLGAAVAAVATAVPGPLGDVLDHVGALYRLGAAPRQAWTGLPPSMAPLARVLVRAGESGSSVVPALQRLAGDLRTGQRAAVEAAVRRAGVWVLAPLGVCFLPAFLCLGVVPMVLGIAADVFG